MPYFLNLLYLGVLLVALPWLLLEAIRKGKYREGFAAKFLGRVPRRGSARPCLWFHAVSVGEVNLLAPLLSQIAAQRPDWECVVSTTTMTGMALARKKYPDLSVFYCPLDFSWAVRAAMGRIRPQVLVLAELELWPNLIRGARQAEARVAVINGRLSDHSMRGYHKIRWLIRSALQQLDLIAVQDETYAERFRLLGARRERLHITGSMKFDGAQTDRNNPVTARLRQLAGFMPEDVVFLAGSTQEPEEAAVMKTFDSLRRSCPALRLVIVPRHPDRFAAVGRLLDQSGIAWRRRSQLVSCGAASLRSETEGTGRRPAADGDLPKVLLVDTVGELGAWWGVADIAFVGGSLGNRGGQNMIEPAAYGAAVSFGPNTRNFRDIVAAMLRKDAAVVVRDGDQLTAFVRRCLEEPHFASQLGARARELVADQLGATERTLKLLTPLVGHPDGGSVGRSTLRNAPDPKGGSA